LEHALHRARAPEGQRRESRDYRLVKKKGRFPAIDLTARVQNLTNERYSEVFGFRALGLNFLAGLRARY
jgi:outer membrane receptor protein involved in Fe transport